MRFAWVILVIGCGFTHGGHGGDGGGSGSGDGSGSGSDGSGMQMDARACFGTGAWTICLTSLPTNALDLGGVTIDTGSDSMCLPAQPTGWATANQPDSCIVAAQTITMNDILLVRGTRPLVLVATDSITVGPSAVIDAASHRPPGKTGPGGNMFPCGVFGASPLDNNTGGGGGGGGAGGGFVTKGGDGGKQNNVNMTNGVAAAALMAPTLLRAGCPGQNGGNGNNQNTGHGIPGDGGGSLYLLAGNKITIAGIVNASGAGSEGGSLYSGGGGGGSGGMIVLYAPTIDATNGNLAANGGGGSSGGDAGTAGNNGNDPDPSLPLATAPGGPAPGNKQGSGGHGFAGAMNAQNGANSGAGATGGGGGGGGGGYILTNHALTGAQGVSPTESVLL